MTERAYYADPYRCELEAAVVRREERQGAWRVVLDRTLFYPEGGGQPADGGTVNAIPLTGLVEEGDEIVHLLGSDPGPGPVKLELDLSRRLALMQQHSGQHLLSQALERLLAARTLSFAIGEGHASIEISRSALSDEELGAIEAECNQVIFENRQLRIFETDDVSAVPLRKPPKVSGTIRVVEIDGYDWSACGGLHVRVTGELGLLKIVRTDKVRGNLRLYFVAGAWALADYQMKNRVLAEVQRLVSQPVEQVPAAIARLVDERDGLKKELRALRRREFERLAFECREEPRPLIVREFPEADPADIKTFALALLNAGRHVLAWTAGPPAYLLIGRGSGSADLRDLSKQVFSLLGGRGGGRDNLVEGRPESLARLKEVVSLLTSSLSQK
jgi:alanyl-tRNA synthetase